MVQRVPLKLGISNKPHLRALIDGTVKPDGIDLNCIYDFPEPSTVERHRRMLSGELDAAEMSTSSFLSARAKGKRLIAIPVYPNRGLRHRNIFCYIHSGIKKPEDLKGKKIGLHRYNATTMVWARGLLHYEFGIKPEEIIWYSAEEEVFKTGKPEGVRIITISEPHTREHLLDMLSMGEIDAAMEPTDLTTDKIVRLFPEYWKVEKEYYIRTGINPIIHTVTIKEEIVEKHPWVAVNLLNAFREAKNYATKYMSDKQKKGYEIDREILGEGDPYDCIFGEKERRTFKTLMQYLIDDRGLDRELDIDSLFAKETI